MGFLPRLCRAAAACLLGLAALGFAASAAQAQAVIDLVKNTGQTAGSGFNLSRDYAQTFTTGSSALGYRLTGLDIRLRQTSGTAPTYTVTIRSNNSSSRPGALVGTMVNPSSLPTSWGNARFSHATGIDLAADTTYWVEIDVSVAPQPVSGTRVGHTDSFDEDSGPAGWDIGNGHYRRDSAATSWSSASANVEPLMLSVRGAEKAPPGVPTGLSVSAGTNSGSLSASWTAPSDTGSSAITDYDLRYYAGSSDPADAADWVVAAAGLPDVGASTSATIEGLRSGTAYRVQVRAGNAAGEGSWSASASATTGTQPSGNNAPRVMYDDGTGESAPQGSCDILTDPATPSYTQNTPPSGIGLRLVSRTTGETTEWPSACSAAGNRVVPVFDDRDADSLFITARYTRSDHVRMLDGPRAVKLADGTQKLQVQGVARRVEEVRVDLTAVDPHGASASTHVVLGMAIFPGTSVPSLAAVGDRTFAADEAIAPFVLPEATGGDTTAVGTAIPDPYFYQVSGLPAGLSFDAATRTVSGTPTETGTFSVTYTADDFDAKSATLNPASSTPSDTASRTFNVEVEGSPAAAPAAPSVSAVANLGDRLTVRWDAPSGAVTDYDVRYYKGSADPSAEADWIEPGEAGGHDHEGTARTATITGLDATTAYRVQVRAVNSAGNGPWSASGGATTASWSGTPTLSTGTLVSNTGQGTDSAWSVGFTEEFSQPFSTGSNAGGYRLTEVQLNIWYEGTAATPTHSVNIFATGSGGQPTGSSLGTLTNPSSLSTGNNTYTASGSGIDLDAGTTYAVVFTGSSSNPTDFGRYVRGTSSDAEDSGGQAGWTIGNSSNFRSAGSTTWQSTSSSFSIAVRGYAKPPPAAPVVRAMPGLGDRLTVRWRAPGGVSGITDYDVRYYKGSADPTDAADWIESGEAGGHDHVGTARKATITGLDASSAYRVQVRAVTSEGNGPWSASGAATTAAWPDGHSALTSGSLVSNTGQPSPGATSLVLSNDIAQGFTTGSNAGGYRLTGVDVQFQSTGGAGTYTAGIWTANTSGQPDTKVGTLTFPASLSAGLNRYTASGGGIDLDADTTYLFVSDTTATTSQNPVVYITSSDNEDSGGEAGWSITDAAFYRAHDATAWTETAASVKIAIHGYAKSPPSGAPAAPSVNAVPLQPDRLSVKWTAPSGAPVTDYDVRYYKGSADPANESDWIESGEAGGHDHMGVRAEATLTGLEPVTTYRVQVRAANDGGAGPWSASGSGRTGGNSGPSGNAVQRLIGNIEEREDGFNNLSGQDVAQAFTTGRHAYGYTVTDVELFFITGVPRSMRVRLVTGASTSAAGTTVATLRNPATLRLGLNSFAAPPGTTLDPETEYFVVVEGQGVLTSTSSNVYRGLFADGWRISNTGLFRIASETGAWTSRSHKARIRINGRETAGDPPGAPDAPTAVPQPGTTGLAVSWFAPDHVGSGITDYDLRYYQGSADPADEADWVEEHETSGLGSKGIDLVLEDASTAAVITGLKASTAYRVQVRAESYGAPGPWSESTAVTTGAGDPANNAPTRAKLGATPADGCVAQIQNNSFGALSLFSHHNYFSVSRLIDTSGCHDTRSSERRHPAFIDPDGDELTVTAVVPNLPDNVRFLGHTPLVRSNGNVLWLRAAVAGATKDVRINITATDPHGASVSAFMFARVHARPNTAKPRFDQMVGVRGFPRNKPIPRWVLPPANGGDMVLENPSGQLPYFYAVSGLPPGLAFDPLTRSVTGTPTRDGTFTVTYTADDADQAYSLKDSPSAEDLADVAKQSFVVRIGAPEIELVQLVSAPTYDADGDGSFDTYIQDDVILIDVQFTQPVEVTGTSPTNARPRLRLDLGPASGSQGNNRVTADLLESGGELYGGRRLRFGYTVQVGDEDPDGVWVQTVGSNKQVVILPTGLGLAGVEGGASALLTFAGVPTEGAANAKVDGDVTDDQIGPRPESAETDADGDTITVTFSRGLSPQVETSGGLTLAAYFSVRGAGPVGLGQRGAYQHPNTVTVRNVTVDGEEKGQLVLELNPASAARASDTVTLTYENAGGGKWPLKDKSTPDAKRVAGFTDLAVVSKSTAVAPPVPLRASAVGTALEVVFDQTLDQDARPRGTAFTVRATGADAVSRTIAGSDTAVTVDGAKVSVVLGAAVAEGDTLSVSYAKPAASPLAAAAGTPAVESFDGLHVEGVHDSTAPKLVGAAAQKSRSADTSASPPVSAQFKVALYYDEPLDEGVVPAAGSFGLEVGGSGLVDEPGSVEIAGNALILTKTGELAGDTQVEVSYQRHQRSHWLQDRAGNIAAEFTRTITAVAPAQPAVQSQFVLGNRLVLTFDHPLDPASVPGPGQFTFHHPGTGSDRDPYSLTVDSVSVRAEKVVLHLDLPVHPCEGVNNSSVPFTVSYSKAAGQPGFRGLDGWGASAFSHRNVSNGQAPKCVGGVREAYFSSVVLVGERPFATGTDPDPAWFTVSASGGAVTVTSAAFVADDPYLLKLEVSREFDAGETVTVSYERPQGERGLWDIDGNQLQDFSNMAVAEAPDGPPAVTEVALVSDAGGDDTYALGEDIRVRVTFDRTVEVTGAPRLAVDMDPAHWGEKQAAYEGGSGTRALTFVHTVVEPNVSTEGVALLANTLELNGGTIRSDAGTDAELGHDGLAHDPAHKVDWTLAPVAAPAVTGVSLASSPASGDTYGPGETIAVEVAWDGDVTWDVSAANAGIGVRLDIGGVTRRAELVTGGATGGTARALRFAYTVAARDADADGIAVTPALNGRLVLVRHGATLRDAEGRDAAVSHAGLAADAGHKVEARAPVTATGIRVSSTPAAGDTYGYGETIRVTLTFSEAVAVTGAPALSIDMDPDHWGEKRAAYEGGSGTNALTFAHTVVEPNISTKGIAVLADTLALDGGTIVSSATGADAKLAHGGLGHDPKHKVDWRPALSVADAEANEGTDEAIEFQVTLNRAAPGRVTVNYATADGTAKAGEDYTAVAGLLTFATGEREKTVSVPILDDALDEGRETFLLRLSNAEGARIEDGEAVGTITNSDPLHKMWLSRFGRTVADHVTSAVADRLANPLSGAQVTVGGQTVDLAETEDHAALTQTLTSLARMMGAPSGPAPADDADGFPGPGPGQSGAGGWPGTGPGSGFGTGPGGSVDAGTPGRLPEGREILLGSAFHLAREGDGGAPGLAAWGRVTAGGFDGEAPADGGSNVRIDGNVTTGILGADAEWHRLLAGVAVSVSEGEGTFDQPGVDSGTIESTMTTVSPYARFMVTDRVSVWGLAGWGTGDMTIVQAANDRGQPERVTRTDLEMRLAALGGRGALLEADEAGGFDLALKADAFWVETESKAISNEGDTKAAASRVRLALEGSRAFRMEGGGTLTPGVELGVRHDGGDAETGTGVELGGRISWTDPETGLSVEGSVRALVAHEDSNYKEWGASGAVRLAPGERGRGLSFSLAPTWGAASSGVERLWGARDARGLAPDGEFVAARGLQGELGYGMGLFGDRFTGTPNVGFGLSDSARDYRIGWRLTSAIRNDPGFEVNLDATRREAANGNEPPEHGVMLRGAIRW